MTLGDAHVTRETSQLIFDDARRAFDDALHPCHRFVGMQRGVAITKWQLPAPFNGHSANVGIVFVRLNPSCDPKEVVPTIGSSFAEWDEFYRRRFDGDQVHGIASTAAIRPSDRRQSDPRFGWEGMRSSSKPSASAAGAPRAARSGTCSTMSCRPR